MTDEEKKELYKMLPTVPKKFVTWAEAKFDGRRTFFFTRKQGNLHVECCHCGSKFVKEDTEEVEEFLHEPCGHVSHHLLHTHYVDRSGEVK